MITLNSVLLPKREILLYHLHELGTGILLVHKVEELTVKYQQENHQHICSCLITLQMR